MKIYAYKQTDRRKITPQIIQDMIKIRHNAHANKTKTRTKSNTTSRRTKRFKAVTSDGRLEGYILI